MRVENAEFDADFKAIEKNVKKFLQKKLLAQKCTKYVLFQLLVRRTKVLSPVTFFVYTFCYFFNGFKISIEFCVY